MPEVRSPASLRGHRAPAGEGDRLRVELLDAAETELAEKGVAGLSLRQVARNCGVSPTAVYLHFDSKESLVIGVCNRRFADLGQRVRTTIPRFDTVIDQVMALGEVYLRFVFENPKLYAAYFGAIPLETILERMPADELAGFDVLAELADLLAVGMEAGEIRRDDPAVLATALWGAVHGAATVLHFSRPLLTASFDDHVAGVLRQLRAGLVPCP